MQATLSEPREHSLALPATNVSRKRRGSTSEKLAIIAPGIALADAQALIQDFCHLFVRKCNHGIATANGNAREWFANRWRLKANDVIRHLVGDKIPGLPPKWIGTRSWPTSSYFVIDIDSDRRALRDEDDSSSLPCSEPAASAKPSFEERCRSVEQCLLRLGIDAHNPCHTLRQPTPSGGIHLYVFLSNQCSLEELQLLLEDAGVRFQKGHAEFFPSTAFGLRLPFGHLPGKVNDPAAWLRFLEDYRSGAINRFSLQSMRDNLLASGYIRAPAAKPPSRPRTKKRTELTRLGSAGHHPGTVEHISPPVLLNTTTISLPASRCKVSSVAEIEKIWSEGIVVRGTRNETLKALAAHFIFIKGLSAAEAEQKLVAWAMDPRHKSDDIENALQHGSQVVAKEITRLCAWHEKRRVAGRTTGKPAGTRFYKEELAFFALKAAENKVPLEDREPFVTFLLYFLNFAKICGTKSDCGYGWVAAPAVQQVMRKWPGSHHMNYKRWIDIAVSLGILILLQRKWQNPRGKGRAQTFFLWAYMQTPSDQTPMTLDEALARLPRMLSVIAKMQAEKRRLPTL